MRLEQIPANISLAAMLPVALAIFAIRKALFKRFAITFATLLALDLTANLTGLGAFFWWSPIHWPSTIALGADEIVENHGVAVTTIGYIVDFIIWSVLIIGVVRIMKKRTPNHTSKGIRQPADGSPKPSM